MTMYHVCGQLARKPHQCPYKDGLKAMKEPAGKIIMKNRAVKHFMCLLKVKGQA